MILIYLKDTIEEKDTQVQKLRKEVKKYKEDKNSLNSELEETRHDLCMSPLRSFSWEFLCYMLNEKLYLLLYFVEMYGLHCW